MTPENSHQLGITFRSEKGTVPLLTDIAQRYGLDVDMIGVYDDLGDYPPFSPLKAAAHYLRPGSEAMIGPVGVAVAKYRSMVDVVGYMDELLDIRPNHVLLGMVPGAWMNAIGLPPASVEQMREAIATSRYLLERRTEGFEGRYFSIEPNFAFDRPARNIPVLLGAWGPNFAALAGEVADEIKVGGSANPLLVPIIQQRLQVGLDKAKRKPEDVGIVFGAVTVIDEDRRQAIEKAKERALVYIGVIGEKDPTIKQEFPEQIAKILDAIKVGNLEEAKRYLSVKLLQRFAFVGTPKDIIAQTEKLFDKGVQRVEYGAPHGTQQEVFGVELLVEQVIPYFKNKVQ